MSKCFREKFPIPKNWHLFLLAQKILHTDRSLLLFLIFTSFILKIKIENKVKKHRLQKPVPAIGPINQFWVTIPGNNFRKRFRVTI